MLQVSLLISGGIMNHILLGPEEGLKADWLNEEKKRVLAEHPDAEVHLIFVGDDKGEDLDSILSQLDELDKPYNSFNVINTVMY